MPTIDQFHKYKICEKNQIKRYAKNITDELVDSIFGTTDLGTIEDDIKKQFFSDYLVHWEYENLKGDRLHQLAESLRKRLGLGKVSLPHFMQPKFEHRDCKYVESLRTCIEKVNKEVATTPKPTLKVRLEWLMFYVITKCGVCYGELANAVLHKVLEPKDPVMAIAGFFLLSVNDTKKSHLYNEMDSQGNLVSRKTIFLQPEAVSAIRGFRTARKQTGDYSHNPANAYKIVIPLLKRHSLAESLSQLSERQFYNICALNIFMTHGARMPSWLYHYARGSVQSASASLKSLKRFFENVQPCRHRKKKKAAKLITEPSLKNRTPVEEKVLPKPSKQRFCVLMINALKDSQTGSFFPKDEARKRLTRLFALEFTMAEKLFLDWTLYEFEHGDWDSSSTAYRNLTALCPAWLTICGHRDLSGLDVDASTQLYEQLKGVRENTDRQVINSLASLFQFASAKEGIALPDALTGALTDDTRTKTKSKTRVVNTLVSENHFKQLLIDIDPCFADETVFIRESVFLMLILMRRTGLRPFEVTRLTLNDISTMFEGGLAVRRNPYGKEKTYSALRQIPLSLLLKPHEFEELKVFVDKRRNRANGEMRRLLFSASQNADVQFSSSTFTIPATRILSANAGEQVPCYQLRHSCITYLQVILFGDDEAIERLTPYSLSTATKIKDWIDRSSENDRLYQLSSVAGHLEQGMTLSTYAHLTDFLLFQSCSRIERRYPVNFWSNLLNVRPSSILKKIDALPDAARDEIYPKTMYAFLLNTQQIKHYQQNEDANRNGKPFTVEANRRTLDDCVTVLTYFDKDPSGYSSQVRKHGIDLRWAETLVKVAQTTKARKEYQTSYNGKKYSRLYPANSSRLAPTKPEDMAETLVYEDICRKIQAAARNPTRRNALTDAADYMMRNMTQGHKQIIFKKPPELHRFLKAFSPIVDAKKWLLEIDPPFDASQRALKAAWINGTDLTVRVTGKEVRRDFPHGRAALSFLASGQSAELIEITNGVKYSSNALRYALHLFALFQKTELRFSSDGNAREV